MPLHVSEAGPHITLVTIDDQAKRNAMSRATLGDLAALWDRLEASVACRCVVITGAGDKAFCAGADIGGDLTASAETARVINRALLKTTPFSKPIVAAVNGDCAGGGVELLLSTDIRIAAEQARFGLPEVRYSIYPFGGATVKLVQQIGYVHAMDLLLTGRLVSADFAAGIGLVNRVLPAAESAAGGARGGSADRGQQPVGRAGREDADQRQHRRLRHQPRSPRAAAGRPRAGEPPFRRGSGGVPREEATGLCLTSSIWRASCEPATGLRGRPRPWSPSRCWHCSSGSSTASHGGPCCSTSRWPTRSTRRVWPRACGSPRSAAPGPIGASRTSARSMCCQPTTP